MISIPDDKVGMLARHYAEIERLRYTPPEYDDYFYEPFWRHSREVFAPFTALRELHVAIDKLYWLWGDSLQNVGFEQCLKENTRFVDLNTGLTLNMPQMDLVRIWMDQKGGMVLDIDDFDMEMLLTISGITEFDLSELAEIN